MTLNQIDAMPLVKRMYFNMDTKRLYIVKKNDKVDVLEPIQQRKDAPSADERNIDTFAPGECFNVQGHTFVKNCTEIQEDVPFSILETRPWLKRPDSQPRNTHANSNIFSL